jgi:hypothetical protein
VREDEPVELAGFLVRPTKEHDPTLRPGPPDERVWRAREGGIGKDFQLYLGSESLGKSAQKGGGHGFTGGEIRDFILTNLYLM